MRQLWEILWVYPQRWRQRDIAFIKCGMVYNCNWKENQNKLKPPFKVKCLRIGILNLNLRHKIGTNWTLHVSKIPFARELLHNKQSHHYQIDPFIMRLTLLLQTKNLVSEIWNTEPEVINWFKQTPFIIIFTITQIWNKVTSWFLQFFFPFYKED